MKTQGWQMAVAIGLGMGGAIGPSSITLAQTTPSNIVPDGTLGSLVIQNFGGLPFEVITGGARRGQNLFHSFSQFNVSAGRGAYFVIPGNIQNVLARVTGNNPSEILGALGASLFSNNPSQTPSNASLFLINPNGIIFGANARLDTPASFIATTASEIQFGNQGFFSATSPNVPQLLTINPSAFLFNRNSNAPIVIQGVTGGGLQVSAGKSLLFLGGDIRVDGATLDAQGGRVELGGIARSGSVELTSLSADRSQLALAFPNAVERADVALINGAQVNVAAAGNGDITIKARNVALSDGSVLFAGVESGLGAFGNRAGDITIDAAEGISLRNGSAIIGGAFGMGDIGSINLLTKSLSLVDGSQIVTTTFGQGITGNINIETKNAIELIGISSSGSSSSILSFVGFGGIGNSGNINIRSGSLALKDGAQISARTNGRGNAGNILIDVRDNITLVGTSPDGRFSSGFSSAVGSGAVGRGGNLNFTAGRLEVREGATISTGTAGIGNAGNLTITGTNVSFDGQSNNGLVSGAFSNVSAGARGNGGALNITVNTLSVTNGAQLSAAVVGSTDNFPGGRGNGGNIRIQAFDSVTLSGVGTNGSSSGLFTNTGRGAVGSAGEITVNVGTFRLADGAIITAQTANSSNAGSVTINANTFEAINGGQVLTTTSGAGNAGSILLTTANAITLSGRDPTFAARFAQFGSTLVVNAGDASGLFASTTANSTGNGGSIVIDPTRLTIERGAAVSVSSFGQGNAGRINAEANSIVLNQGKLTAESTAGNGGDIQLRAKDFLFLRNNSLISAVSGTTGINGNDGNIDIAAKYIIVIPSENSDIIATGFGRSIGSNVRVTAQGIFGTQFRAQQTPESDILATGTVTFNSPDTSFLQNSLTQFPQTYTDTTQLLANSCIVRSSKQNGRFVITGSGGLPQRPGDAPLSSFPTGEVRGVGEGEKREEGREKREEGREKREERRVMLFKTRHLERSRCPIARGRLVIRSWSRREFTGWRMVNW